MTTYYIQKETYTAISELYSTPDDENLMSCNPIELDDELYHQFVAARAEFFRVQREISKAIPKPSVAKVKPVMVDSHTNDCEYCCSMLERFTYPSSLSDTHSPDEIENLYWSGDDTHGIVYEDFGECPCQTLIAGADEVWYEDEA